jgi:hypothetical protein
MLRWTLAATKTAAGTATGVYKIHFGAYGSTGDTARVTFDNDETTLIARLSCNPGTSGAWTFQTVHAKAANLK